MTPLAPHLTAFLRERLPRERHASPHTCDAYAYAFQLLLSFASNRLRTQPSSLALEQLDVPLVLAFAWAIIYGPSGFVTLFVRTTFGLPTWELYSVAGIALVAAVYYVPYTYLYSTGSLALTDPQLEDAGRIAGAGPLHHIGARLLWVEGPTAHTIRRGLTPVENPV